MALGGKGGCKISVPSNPIMKLTIDRQFSSLMYLFYANS